MLNYGRIKPVVSWVKVKGQKVDSGFFPVCITQSMP